MRIACHGSRKLLHRTWEKAEAKRIGSTIEIIRTTKLVKKACYFTTTTTTKHHTIRSKAG
jgi:hypothetical protein